MGWGASRAGRKPLPFSPRSRGRSAQTDDANQVRSRQTPPYEGGYPCGAGLQRRVVIRHLCLHPSGMVQQNAMPYNWPWLGPSPGSAGPPIRKDLERDTAHPRQTTHRRISPERGTGQDRCAAFCGLRQEYVALARRKSLPRGHGASSGPEGRGMPTTAGSRRRDLPDACQAGLREHELRLEI